jgi:DNA-directed RNA polymerase subunit RPC12/RpoP
MTSVIAIMVAVAFAFAIGGGNRLRTSTRTWDFGLAKAILWSESIMTETTNLVIVVGPPQKSRQIIREQVMDYKPLPYVCTSCGLEVAESVFEADKNEKGEMVCPVCGKTTIVKRGSHDTGQEEDR